MNFSVIGTRRVQSMALVAGEAGVRIVTGDTKVVEGDGGLFINTAGIGLIHGSPVSFKDAEADDALLVTGTPRLRPRATPGAG